MLKLKLWNYSSLKVLNLKKIIPYDINNKCDWMKQEPFRLMDLYYRNSKNQQVVFLIHSDSKKILLKELAEFNITEDFIYPDMDDVAHKLN